MKILAIETSCDETAASVLENNRVIANIVASSGSFHTQTGGIIPENAAREQIKAIIPVIKEALDIAKTSIKDIDSLAVTNGPGLIGSLLVGVEAAKTLSFFWKKPIIPVNHLVAHIYANFIENKNQNHPDFPALALVVSGGHTDLVLMKNHGNINYLGGTRDDAAGEAFDKAARLLGLPYPGGPSISSQAQKYLEKNIEKLNFFPRPLIKESNFDFSFSGLKTALLRETQKKKLNLHQSQKLAANFQEAIVDVLVAKTLQAANTFAVKSILLGGGVAANQRLRERLSRECSANGKKLALHVPPVQLCTDNAAIIGTCAFFNQRPVAWKKIKASPELSISD